MRPNGLELSRPHALGSPRSTVQPLQREFESPFSAAARVGSSEMLGIRRGGVWELNGAGARFATACDA